MKASTMMVQQEFFQNPDNSEDYTMYYGIQKIFAFILLLTLMLIIIGTPVILGFYWIENLFCFHDECKKNVSVASLNEELEQKPPCQSDCKKYKKTVASLYGNGFGFLGWIVLTIWHILANFGSFTVGLKSYFNFPFSAMRTLDVSKNNIFDQIATEVWLSMLLIVGLALVLYIVGRVVGSTFASRTLKRTQLLFSEIRHVQ